MEDELDVEKIVTKFLLNTCLMRPKFNMAVAEAATRCGQVAMIDVDEGDAKADCIPLTTGSVAEFYIEPMFPYTGDVDVMFYANIQLATPRGHPPPTQLPAEFHNYVKVLILKTDHQFNTSV